jgi:hypothetical protein
MTDPAPLPPAGGLDLDAAEIDRAVAEAAAELDRDGESSRLVRSLAIGTRVVRSVGALGVLCGLAGLVLGLWAWHGSLLAVVVVLVLTLPAVLLPTYAARRIGALLASAAHPRELVDQTRDLLRGLRSSAELKELAGLAGRIRSGGTAGTGRGAAAGAPRRGVVRRVRTGLRWTRLASAVVGQATPDPERHDRLVPLAPERLRATWLGTLWGLWASLVAAAVAVVSLLVLLVRAAV